MACHLAPGARQSVGYPAPGRPARSRSMQRSPPSATRTTAGRSYVEIVVGYNRRFFPSTVASEPGLFEIRSACAIHDPCGWPPGGGARCATPSFLHFGDLVRDRLGVTALIVVLSVMNAFQRAFVTHAVGDPAVQSKPSTQRLPYWESWRNRATPNREVLATPMGRRRRMLVRADAVRGGPISESTRTGARRLGQSLTICRARRRFARAGHFGLILGRDLAPRAGVRRGRQSPPWWRAGKFCRPGLSRA